MKEPFKLNMNVNHWKILLKCGFCSVSLRSVQDSVFLTSSQVMFIAKSLDRKVLEAYTFAEEKQFMLRQNKRLNTILHELHKLLDH